MSAAASKISAGQTARLLPEARFGGPIPWVIAILIALMVLAAAGGLALRNLAENARADLSGALTVQIIETNLQTRTERVQAAASTLADHSMVQSVRVVPEKELTALLEPWLGPGAVSRDVPIPALIDVELTTNASAEAVSDVQAALDQAVPGTKVDAQSAWLKPVYSALAALQWLALALITLFAFVTVAAVWLAVRSAFADHRDTVEMIHLLGGTEQQITRVFQRIVLRETGFGALLGLALGALAVWVLGQQFAALDSGMVTGTQLGWADWLIIGAIPLMGILLSLMTARFTISLALRAML